MGNKFDNEIIPIEISKYVQHSRHSLTFYKDEGPRSTTLEKLSKLKSSFKKNGTITAGNSSQMSDGAAFSILCNKEYADKHELKILGAFREYSVVGVPPNIMGIGPIPAITQLLKKTNLNIKDIGLFEINEAFAAQA